MACLVSRFLTAEICKHRPEITPVHGTATREAMFHTGWK